MPPLASSLDDRLTEADLAPLAEAEAERAPLGTSAAAWVAIRAVSVLKPRTQT